MHANNPERLIDLNTFAVNSLNRSMGLSDHYPFTLTTEAIDKLRFVHDVIEACHASSEVRQVLVERWTQRLGATA